MKKHLALIVFALSGCADTPPPVNTSLLKTKVILKTPELRREKFAEMGQNEAEAKLDQVTHNNEAHKERLVSFVADEVLPWMVQETGNDVGKMKALAEEMRRDPQSFMRRLPSGLRERGQKMIDQIQDEQEAR